MHRQSILRDLAPTRSLRRERRVNEPWRDLHGSDLRLHRGRVRSRRRRFVGSIVVLAFRSSRALQFGFLTPLPAHSSSLNLASRKSVCLYIMLSWLISSF
ncbi:hypothetical protein B0H13DRAFT_2689556, partial [Mycena leptocephala]